MKIINRTIHGRFVHRLNRFEGIVEVNGREVPVHIPNTGRCRELLLNGARVILEIRESKTRKTPYELIMVYKGERLISIDSQAPNKIVEEAVRENLIKEIGSYEYIKREAFYQSSRFDMLLKKTEESEKEESCYIEVKGVTLEIEGTALFPDAPTERGARHMKELTSARQEGYRAAVIFLVQMENIKTFTPNKLMDGDFSKALAAAHSEGVEVLSYSCRISEKEVVMDEKVEVLL
ncbi:MAG: DNA/RNA nuclease SfsA [Clostridiaceae bacterium]|nr:DNA/RNA nuclease SfsA [Clostridiaceae bacterium]